MRIFKIAWTDTLDTERRLFSNLKEVTWPLLKDISEDIQELLKADPQAYQEIAAAVSFFTKAANNLLEKEDKLLAEGLERATIEGFNLILNNIDFRQQSVAIKRQT